MDGANFFDRETELEALQERVREGTHTLLTAQRRMGKTSLVRELQGWLPGTGPIEDRTTVAQENSDKIAGSALQVATGESTNILYTIY